MGPRTVTACLGAWLLGSAGAALAQTFPADTAWVPFRCGAEPMTDAVGDQGGFPQDRDVVGTTQMPAGQRASDQQFLYLRLRLDDDPRQGPNLRAAAWGFAFSTDALATTYEALVTVDGANRTVNLYRNTVTTMPDNPEDPADPPPLATYPFATHGRVVAAPGNLGGGADHFLDIAVPWPALMMAGLTPETIAVVWAASSTSADRLNGDFACHDGRGQAQVPRLSEAASASERAVPGSAPGSGGAPGAGGMAGGGAGGAGGLSLEGGPGCAYGAGAAGGWLATALVGLGLFLTIRMRPGGNRRQRTRNTPR